MKLLEIRAKYGRNTGEIRAKKESQNTNLISMLIIKYFHQNKLSHKFIFESFLLNTSERKFEITTTFALYCFSH